MAVVTRRYRRLNVTTAMLQQRVQSGASVNLNFTNGIDINIDNATTNFAEDLNEFMAAQGFVFDAALTAVDVESHGSRHTSAGADAIANATTSTAGIMTAADKTKIDGVTSRASTQVICFGTFTLTPAGAGTVFINNIGGFDDANVGAEGTEHPCPFARGGTFSTFYVYHNTAVGDGDTVTYTIMVNGAATGITATLASNSNGPATDVTHTAAISQGDRVSVRAVKNADITNPALATTGSFLFKTT